MTEPDIIALIDGAIEDWAVSDDAMRWTPDDVQPRRAGSPWITTGEVHAFAVDPADPERTLTRFSLNGIDFTPYVSSVEIRGAEPDLTIIDETHRWSSSGYAGLVAGVSAVGQAAAFSYESLMETYHAILAATPQPQPYICSPDEYERIKAGLVERGVDVDLTASPYVPAGTVVQLGPTVRAGIDYRFGYHADFDLDRARYRAEYLLRPLATTRMAGLFDVSADLLAYGNAYIDLRPRRAKLRAIHTAYRAKTRRRNRRTR